MEFNFNIYETMALVSIVFYIGKYIRNKFSILSKYCIPPSVVGGFIFALLILIFKLTNIATINLDTTLQNIFMTAFFTSIGFTASIKILKKGGVKVITFLGLAILLVILQNTVGVTLASLFNLTPLLGLCTGSIPMVGGHGTAGSFGPILEDIGITGATTVSIASATFGLIMGSIIGGLVARGLMIMLFAQVLLVGLFAYFITYKVMGRNYEAAVFASATCGFGMGATPNAIANMDELTNRYGFVHTPYFVVPIVGCLFIDFVNSAIITTFINFIG